MMSNVFVITDVLSKSELLAFKTECDFYRKVMRDTDPLQLGAAIDIFENSHIDEGSKIRRDPHSYFEERWRGRKPDDEDANLIRSYLLTKLPAIICKIYSCHQLYIFNESYIVKEPQSHVAFRWHIDSDEQLGAIPLGSRSQYYSAWCPLDSTNIHNGSLAFPFGTKFTNLVLGSEIESKGTKFVSGDALCGTVDSSVVSPSESDDGLILTVEAGTIVLFSSGMWHKSGDNTTIDPRRVLYVQYSPDIITSSGSYSERSAFDASENISNNACEIENEIIKSNLTIDKEIRRDKCPLCFAVDCSPNDIGARLYDEIHDSKRRRIA
jgi:hypothetical protein